MTRCPFLLLSLAQAYFLLSERSDFWGWGGERCSPVLEYIDCKRWSNPCSHQVAVLYLEGITERVRLLCLQNSSHPYHTAFLLYFSLGTSPPPPPPSPTIVCSHSLVSF